MTVLTLLFSFWILTFIILDERMLKSESKNKYFLRKSFFLFFPNFAVNDEFETGGKNTTRLQVHQNRHPIAFSTIGSNGLEMESFGSLGCPSPCLSPGNGQRGILSPFPILHIAIKRRLNLAVT